MTKSNKSEVAMRALMSQRLNNGTRVARGERFACGVQEARDRKATGKAEESEVAVEKATAKAPAKADQPTGKAGSD